MTHEFEKEQDGVIRVWEVSTLWFLAGRDGVREKILVEDFINDTPWGDESLTPKELARHVKRVNRADILFPIIISPDGDLMDGYHRVTKAHLMGHKTIDGVRFEEWPEPQETREVPSKKVCTICGALLPGHYSICPT